MSQQDEEVSRGFGNVPAVRVGVWAHPSTMHFHHTTWEVAKVLEPVESWWRRRSLDAWQFEGT